MSLGNRQFISESERSPGSVTSSGVGPISLDVEMARKHGWTTEQIDVAAYILAEISRANSKAVALRNGHTRQCPVCECWTVPHGNCHLCEENKQNERRREQLERATDQ